MRQLEVPGKRRGKNGSFFQGSRGKRTRLVDWL
jgi:hypothetical protein